jgi:hypothetical protein
VLYSAYGGGDSAVSGLSDEPNGEVTEGGHDVGTGAGPDPGGVLTERDITDPVNFVLDRPVART